MSSILFSKKVYIMHFFTQEGGLGSILGQTKLNVTRSFDADLYATTYLKVICWAPLVFICAISIVFKEFLPNKLPIFGSIECL